MTGHTTRTASCAIGLLLAASLTGAAGNQAPQAPNANARFGQALTTMNAINTASIVYSATGSAALPDGKGRMQPAAPVTKYTVAINYGMMSSRVAVQRSSPPKHVVQYMAGDRAWDVADGKKPKANAAAVIERQRMIAMTPHGVMRAAFDPAARRTMANEAGADGKLVTTMTFQAAGSPMKAYLDDAALITRVQTLPGDPVLGDTIVETVFSDYKDSDTSKPPAVKPPGDGAYGGIPFPSRIVQRVGGQTVLDLTVTEVTPNAGLYVEVPESVEKASARK